MTTVNDIVPQSVLVRIANRIANSARQFARKTGSKRIPRAIKVGNVHATQLTASITIVVDTNIAPQAMAFEKGAKRHPITPSTKKALWFPYAEGSIYPGAVKYTKNGVVGITTKAVNHPGMEKRPFLQPAKDKNRQKNLQELREAVGRNMRLQVRGMAKKF